MMHFLFSLFILGAIFLSSCNPYSPSHTLSFPQPMLSKIPVMVGTNWISAEVADSPTELKVGLMGRESLDLGSGMLFVFPRPQRVGFWMENTSIPLSVAYINEEGVIKEIHDLTPFDKTLKYSKDTNILYALEVPLGWFNNHQVTVGHKVQFPSF